MADYLSRIRDIQSRAADGRAKMAEVQEQLSGRQSEQGRENREDYLEHVRDNIENFQARMQDVMGIGTGVAGVAKNLRKYRDLVSKRRAALGARRGQTESDGAASDATSAPPENPPAGDSSGARAAASEPAASSEDVGGLSNLVNRGARQAPFQRPEDAPGQRRPPEQLEADQSEGASAADQLISDGGPRAGPASFSSTGAGSQATDPTLRADQDFAPERGDIPSAPPIRDAPSEGATPSSETNALRPEPELVDQGGVDRGLASGLTEAGEMTGMDMALGSVPVLGEVAAAIGGIVDAISGAVQAGKEAAKEKAIDQAPVQQQAGIASSGADPDALAE